MHVGRVGAAAEVESGSEERSGAKKHLEMAEGMGQTEGSCKLVPDRHGDG